MLFEYFILGFYFLISLPYLLKLKAVMFLNFNWLVMTVIGLCLHYFLFYLILKIKKCDKAILTTFFLSSYGVYLSSLFLFNYKMDRSIIASALENEIEMIFYFITLKSVVLTLLVAGIFYFIISKIKFNSKKYCFYISSVVVFVTILFSAITKNRVYLMSYPIIDCFDLLKIGKTLKGLDEGNTMKYEDNEETLKTLFKYNRDDINVVLVVGESVRNDYFTKYATNIEKHNIIRFKKSHSNYFYTRDCVPELLTLKKDGVNYSIVDIMNSMDFNTHWIGAQSIKGATDSPYAHFALKSKNRIYKDSNRNIKYDFELLDYLDNFLYNSGKNFYIIHQYGSHTPFYKRFEKEYVKYENYCKTKDVVQCTTEQVENAYINSIVYTDLFLDKLMEKFKDKKTLLLFTSDHSLDAVHIDESENRKTVPMFVWFGGDGWDESIKNRVVELSKNEFHHERLVGEILRLLNVEY